VTAMPSLVFVVTGWKSNGKENACLQSWSTFVGGGANDFICIMGKVGKNGHMYQSLKETGVCVLNFPSNDIYDRCIKTIGNNQFEADIKNPGEDKPNSAGVKNVEKSINQLDINGGY